MRRIVVVGDVVVDVVARARTAPEPGSDTPADVRVTGGGAGGNVAAWLAVAGSPVTLVARVGDDLAGRGQAAALTGLGVRCPLTVDDALPTGTVVAVVAADGERSFLTDRGAAHALAPSDVPPLDPGSHVHVSGYVLLHDGSRDAGLAVLAAARRAGCTTSVDPASVAPLRAAGVERFRAWTRGVDVVLPNAVEARALVGDIGDTEAVARVLAAAHPVVAVTDGARGAVWAARGAGDEVAVGRTPAVEARAVDTTGAGDAFTAGFLAAWTSGEPVAAATGAGARLAARAVAHLGARPR